MRSNSDIYEFILDNIQRIVIPESIIKIDLSVSKLDLVALLLAGKNEHTTMTGLSQGISVPMSTATGIVDRLVRKGLLKRGRSEEDRRVVTVSLTEKGRALVEEVKAHSHQLIDGIRSTLTEEEFETGLKLMHKVITGFREAGPGPAGNTSNQRRVIEIE